MHAGWMEGGLKKTACWGTLQGMAASLLIPGATAVAADSMKRVHTALRAASQGSAVWQCYPLLSQYCYSLLSP